MKAPKNAKVAAKGPKAPVKVNPFEKASAPAKGGKPFPPKKGK
jgi:hypothetical protein